MEKQKKSKKSLWYKIPLIIICSLVGLFCLVWGCLSVLKFAIYSDFYSVKQDIATLPGLNDNFVPQGICVSEENDVYIISGYMSDKTNSRLYITNTDNESRYVTLTRNGKLYKGHAGGVATTGDHVFIANDERIFTIELDDVLNKDITNIDIGEGIKVNNAASYVFTNDEFLYVGEFHDGGAYVTDHEYKTEHDGTYYAICSKYDINDFINNDGSQVKPIEVYSIRNKVQGFAVKPNGDIILSTSYGLTDSVFYYYNSGNKTDSGGLFFDDAPLYYLDQYDKTLKGPAMSEDLDYNEETNQIITLTESACNKYVFGKFFFATTFFGLDW